MTKNRHQRYQNTTVLTDRFDRALLYATLVHGGQVRKGTSTPYIAHLLAVAATVLEYGGDEDLAIAVLLHDSVEDQGGKPRLADVRNRFGARVATIVEACWRCPRDVRSSLNSGVKADTSAVHLRARSSNRASSGFGLDRPLTRLHRCLQVRQNSRIGDVVNLLTFDPLWNWAAFKYCRIR